MCNRIKTMSTPIFAQSVNYISKDLKSMGNFKLGINKQN